ncbi:MAG: tryptophan synthase subunit alpha [Pseudomonadota bacterium]|nr:tryptophan synthase subunit alpha [Pseudomonadota bacterium]
MSRIASTFQQLAASGRKALIPFFTAGDPDPATCVPLMHALVKGGANIIELGVPFSDPMADGPVIQRSSERALKHGVSLLQVFEMVRSFREQDGRTPVVVMGYANPIERLGFERFAEVARQSGVDGVVAVDYPPEECEELVLALRKREIDLIFLLAPTTTDARMDTVSRLASGYVYHVSLRGVTGAAHIDTAEVARQVERIRRHVQLPVGVGFGIRDAETACTVADVADAVVVGSRIVLEIEAAPAGAAPARVGALMQEFRSVMDCGAR